MPSQCVGLKFFNFYGPNEYYKANQTSVVYKAFQQHNQSGFINLFKSYNKTYKDG